MEEQAQPVDSRQADKAAAKRSGWSYELMWVSCRTSEQPIGIAAAAKRFTARAERRVARFQVASGLEDYYQEEQERLDALYDSWEDEDYL